MLYPFQRVLIYWDKSAASLDQISRGGVKVLEDLPLVASSSGLVFDKGIRTLS